MHICLPFHHSTCTQRDFKFCLSNQSAEKASHFTLLQFTTYRKWKRKTLRHTCITMICRYLQICSHLVNKLLKKHQFLFRAQVNRTSLCLELHLKKKKQFQKSYFKEIWTLILHVSLLLFNPFLSHVEPKDHKHLKKQSNFSCRFV